MADAWRDELTERLGPFVGLLGDRRRARMCPAYVEGLIGPGDRKSVQPMAMRFIYMLSGTLTYRHGGSTYELRPGDSMLFDSGAMHGPERIGPGPTTYLSIIAYARSSR
ncbi:cupin domain-containing protein [Sphingosinicella microcystinivorans]|uniref:cupin domain-containing protein n=1 Tax=Sphingosinicella microcystinivorans TaxID=335406 RepID=UPI00300E3D86